MKVFGELLRSSRAEAGLSADDLAVRAGTSRAAIADYEAGRKSPRVDTAERIMNALGMTLTAVRVPRRPARAAVFDRDDSYRLTFLQSSPEDARKRAYELLPEIIEASCAVEDIALDWGQVTALADGITIGGDPLRIWRATEIARSARTAIKGSGARVRVPLRTVAGDTLIEEDPAESPGARQLEFLVNAIGAGADTVLTLHRTSTSLMQDGLPWLSVEYGAIPDFQKAIVATKRTGDGTHLIRILVDSAERAHI
ncbi:helix-turn-helix transcriptional regulator [Microbacterium sp. KSW4-17]|uniref:Helix-turn-helix transcriptional regulator n=1 Tax=Microbacterium galbum TaxID=3075994 RepID=A0ABU3T677_9MICO|nr:helix-turn-helix transcriptional regulator [Microbacterium sp. KSW4-17]MDU0366875.1 helix-turn-helix transcriptional regulator [Microbacterium sp. KSW4-17]